MFVCRPSPSSNELFVSKNYACLNQIKTYRDRDNKKGHQLNAYLSSRVSRQDVWSLNVSGEINRPRYHNSCKYYELRCQSALTGCTDSIFGSASLAMTRLYEALRGHPLLLQLLPAFGVVTFTLWGLQPLTRYSRHLIFRRSDANWEKSVTYYVCTSYLTPLLLWSGAIIFCRALDPLVLSSERSQIVKQRLLHFVRSLSTVLAFSFCSSSLIQQVQKNFMETNDHNDARNMGFQFAGKAVYTAVWIAAISLFIELLGFSTQRWLTAGGLGTVLLTLAGREIFTNFLSSIMIHTTRPFVFNEWIQTTIQGYEVSGTVEQVGWWSPTIIRGEDREAIHIPNHKFTVNVVRNLTQKTHWRVKTHFAISHLDARKINNIVADMRKVLAKNPQVEQQRLHRRVFLEYINTENQAFMILISCFVKTSHFEEYLCVKEAILLDLLRVISHHRARLATPIRTMQKMYTNAEVENFPFSEAIFTGTKAPVHDPLYLIDSTSRINGDDRSRGRTTSRVNGESPKAAESVEVETIDHFSEGPTLDKKQPQKVPNTGKSTLASEDPPKSNLEEKKNSKGKSGDTNVKSMKANRSTTQTSNSSSIPHAEALKISEAASSVKSLDEALPANCKNENEKLPTTKSTNKPSLEENIILGMTLDGGKQTLPIDEMDMSPCTESEMAAIAKEKGKGNGSALPTKNKKDGQKSTTTKGTFSVEQQDKEK